MYWIATHKGCYFWVRSIFQIVAFSLLIVTLVMLNEFQSPYWHVTVCLLVAIHSIDFVSFTLDLIGFAKRNVHIMRYKIALDVFSFGMSLCMQSYFGNSLSYKTEESQRSLGQETFTNFIKMRQWLCVEVALSYLAILTQLLFFTYVYCTINTNSFQEKYHNFRIARQIKNEENTLKNGLLESLKNDHNPGILKHK